VAVEKNLQANRIEVPHLAFGWLLLAWHGLQATDVFQALLLFFDVVPGPRKKQHSRRQVLSNGHPGHHHTGDNGQHSTLHGSAHASMR